MSSTETVARAPIDLSQFREVFFEEAAEHLDTMETLLVGLDVARANDEDLNAIFRAAHSIKGGAATFGLAEIADATHVVESLLDQLRKHELVLEASMVDTLLAARDLLAQLLEGARGGLSPTAAEQQAMRERVEHHLQRASVCAAVERPQPQTGEAATLRQCIELTLHADDGTRIDDAAVERALGAYGQVTRVADAASSNGETAHAVVCFEVDTPIDVDLIDELGFIVNPACVRLVQVAECGCEDDESSAVVAGASSANAADPGYGFFEGAAGTDAGFGFFDGAPGVPASNDKAAAQPSARAAPATAQSHPAEMPARASRSAGGDTSIRVPVEKVDSLINLVGELVITQAMLAQGTTSLDPVVHERMLNGLALLDRNTRALQEAVMSVRMIPIGVLFSRFPRVVRDLAGRLDKQVELQTEGEGTELDRGLVEKVVDPLTHLVRNCLDHGIESAAERIAAGKPVKGTITLRAFHRGGSIVIEVADDGRGLNRERILAKARERGMSVNDAMPDAEVWALIFEAGFSTAEVVTDVSGRGVGMDVVRRNVGALSGSVDIDSAYGVGTRIAIRLPLTLAIMDGMSVGVGGETYILPLASVVESLRITPGQVRAVVGRGQVVEIRNEYLPVVSMRELFPSGSRLDESTSGVMVIVEADGRKAALLVDELLGQHQVVVKSLDRNYRRVRGVSGATIMGDGRVALILDVATIVRMSRH